MSSAVIICHLRQSVWRSKHNLRKLYPTTSWCRLQAVMKSQKSGNVSKLAREEDIKSIRNIGIMAHIDAGKTTTTERMLYFSGFSRHLGDVDRGDTVTDYMEEERERGITISSAAVSFYWNKHKINLIDTPGHVDFTLEVERSLRVLDGAVAVLDASAGVEAQTLTVWRQANKFDIPRVIFLNKMDKLAANFNMCLKSIRDKLHVEPIPINLPIGREKTFSGIVDLVTLEQQVWDLDTSKDGRKYDCDKIDLSDSSSSTEAVIEARGAMIGQLADLDDAIAEHVLSDMKLEDIPVNNIRAALRHVTLSQKAVIVLCGSSKKNIGIQPLMDSVVHYLPSPVDVHYDFLRFYGQELCALAFKIVHDVHRGALTFVRIYSGSLRSGTSIHNINLSTTEKLGQDLYQVNADEYKQIKELGPGNIVCIAGLTETQTGDTLTSTAKSAQEAAVLYQQLTSGTELRDDDDDSSDDLDLEGPVLAGVDVPPAVFFCSVEAPSVSQQRALEKALERLQREDPSLHVDLDQETGQMILSGMGELHLDIVHNRLKQEYGIESYLGPLQIAYREIIRESVDWTTTMDSKIGSANNSVTISIRVVPNHDVPLLKRVVFPPESLLHLRHKQKAAITNGVKSALSYGPVLHAPVMEVEVFVTDVQTTRGTSLPFLQAAASECVRQALRNTNCFLTEPIMAVEVYTDETHQHNVNTDLIKRRGEILLMSSPHEHARVLSAHVPLAELVGYSTALRSMTSGTASFTMELSHHCQLTQGEQTKVINSLHTF